MQDIIEVLKMAKKALDGEDPRPYGNKTVMVAHPALATYLEQFKPDDPYQFTMGMIGGMPVYFFPLMIDDNGKVVMVPVDKVFFAHEDSLWRFSAAESLAHYTGVI